MCSIFGMGFFDYCSINPFVLKNILRKLTEEAQVRGRDATGLAFTTEDGVSVFKHNVPATQFTQLAGYREYTKRFVRSREGERLYSILGHCRHETLGSHTNPLNNHPIIANQIVGVHNGHINNHKEVFEILKGVSDGFSVERAGQVDSEAIFRAIDLYSRQLKNPTDASGVPKLGTIANPTTKAIQKTAPLLSGGFACATVDADNPKCMWLFKGSGPIDLRLYEEEGLVLFASSDVFMQAAMSSTAFSTPEKIKVDVKQGICFNLAEGTFSRFSLDEELRRARSAI